MAQLLKYGFCIVKKKINLSGTTEHTQLPIKSGKGAKAWGYPRTNKDVILQSQPMSGRTGEGAG